MKLCNHLLRKYKLWRIAKHDRVINKRIRRAKRLKFWTGKKHYVLFDYQDRIVVVNTQMLEKLKTQRLLKRNWSKHIIYETK